MHARKSMSVLLAVVIVLGLVMTTSYGVTRAEPAQEDYQVTYGSKSRSGFNIDGDTIVWQEMGGMSEYYVYMYDTATKTETKVTSSSNAMVPDVNGDVIVWQDSRNGYSDIYMYNMDTKQEKQITDTPETSEMFPVIDGDYIVYKPTHQSLAVYSISTGTTDAIAGGSNYLSEAAIDNGKVVWVDNPYGSPKLQLYDIATKVTRTLKTGTSSQFDGSPDISGDKVVWTNNSGGVKNVYVYDLITEMESAVAPDSVSQQTVPAIDGSKIVWLNFKSATEEQVIYRYDLDEGDGPRQISSTVGTAQTPKIYGDTVVWSLGFNLFSNQDIGLSLLDIVNAANEPAKMQEVLEYTELELTLGDYKDWKKADKLAVAQQFIDNRPGSGFSSLDDLQSVFDTAYADREAVAAVNFADDAASLQTALESGAFQQIDLTGFQSLSAVDREAAMFSMFVALPADGFADETAIQTALDAAVDQWTSAMWKYVGALDFAEWFGDLELYEGTPYVAHYQSYGDYEGGVSKFDGTEWVAVGENVAGVNDPAMAIDGNGVPYIAYSNQDEDNRLTVRKLNGTQWDIVGTGNVISEGSVLDVGIAIDENDKPYVTYRDTGLNQKIAVKAFNGTDWELLGTDYVTNEGENSSGRHTAFVIDGSTPYIAYSDDHGGGVVVKTWDGDEWTPIGSRVSGGGTLSISLAVNGNTLYVASTDGDENGKLYVKTFDGSEWVPLGDNIGGNNAQNVSLAFDSDMPYLAFRDQTLGFKAFVKKFNGSRWATVGEASVTDAEAEYTKLVIEDGTAFLGYLNRYEYVNKTNVRKAILSKGDVNGDGSVTPADALYVTKSVQGKITLTAHEKYILDMNDDGEITVEDAQLILKMYMGAK